MRKKSIFWIADASALETRDRRPEERADLSPTRRGVLEEDLLRHPQHQEDGQSGLRKESDISRYVPKSWFSEKIVEWKMITSKDDRWVLKSSHRYVFVRYELVLMSSDIAQSPAPGSTGSNFRTGSTSEGFAEFAGISSTRGLGSRDCDSTRHVQ
jgi:hypothetical protein